MSSHTPRELWGKDHLSLLLYCETRVVDGDGTLDPRRLRPRMSTGGTKLRGGKTLLDHGDLDCLVDLEQEGMILNRGSGTNPLVVLTNRGNAPAGDRGAVWKLVP